MRVRTYRPPGRSGGSELPGVLFLHGGGYAVGSPEQFAAVYRMLVRSRACVVVAPDYRKSLEAPYPAALNDCYGSLLWLKRNAAQTMKGTMRNMSGERAAVPESMRKATCGPLMRSCSWIAPAAVNAGNRRLRK